LDPRAKLNDFTKTLQIMSEILSRDYSDYHKNVKIELAILFSNYESKYGGVRLQGPPQPSHGGGTKVCSWNRLFGIGPASATTTTSQSPASQFDELTTYLDSDPVSQFDDSFSILSWWHDHKRTYHVLSILAKDIMTVPVSTISLESVFPLCGRVIEKRRRSLTFEHVEMLSLLKDWEQGDARQQHNMEDKELEEKMANLYLDAHGIESRPDGAAAEAQT
jgi:hypothetical protein